MLSPFSGPATRVCLTLGFAWLGNEVAAMPAQQVEVVVTTDKSIYASGEPVNLRIELTNRTAAPVEFTFSSGQRYDFVLLTQSGDSIWRWSEGKGFIQMIGSEIVEPEGRLHYEEKFSRALDAGTYRVIGYVTARDVELKDELEITIR